MEETSTNDGISQWFDIWQPSHQSLINEMKSAIREEQMRP